MGSPEVLYGDTLSRLASKFNLEMVAFDACWVDVEVLFLRHFSEQLAVGRIEGEWRPFNQRPIAQLVCGLVQRTANAIILDFAT